MSRDWPTVNFPTDHAISISPRRAAERLSLPANPSRSAAPPSFFRGDADLQDLVTKGALTKTGELRHTRYFLNLAERRA
jgi:hypothetical protein